MSRLLSKLGAALELFPMRRKRASARKTFPVVSFNILGIEINPFTRSPETNRVFGGVRVFRVVGDSGASLLRGVVD